MRHENFVAGLLLHNLDNQRK